MRGGTVVSKHAHRGSEEVVEVAREALRHLAWLRSAGVSEVPAPTLASDIAPHGLPAEPAAAPKVPARGGPTAGAPSVVPAPSLANPAHADPDVPSSRYTTAGKGCGSPALLGIRRELGECTRCKLAGTRTHVVFGVGSSCAEIMFVGEGPGADEDQQGEPFVGKAGQLLTKMIEAMGFRREDVYIANVVKCRPPGNRNPEPDEIAACEPFLRAQIAAISPKVIVALGKFAAQTLLRDTTPISKLRGRWSSYEGVKLMPTFHPAYLLRSPEEKKKAWEDLQLVMRELGRPLPRR
jgi:uracil-DNA glycosylase family 4